MNAEGNLAAEEIEWIASYASEVAETFGVAFGCAEARLAGSMRLLQRFTDASERVLQNGLRDLSSINEAHNELCVANALLVDSGLRFSTVEYEPVLPGCSKSIDFRATTDEGRRFFVDVKAIQPKPTDRWDQFERAVREGWFPENVRVCYAKRGSEANYGTICSRRVGGCLNTCLSLRQRFAIAKSRTRTQFSSLPSAAQVSSGAGMVLKTSCHFIAIGRTGWTIRFPMPKPDISKRIKSRWTERLEVSRAWFGRRSISGNGG